MSDKTTPTVAAPDSKALASSGGSLLPCPFCGFEAKLLIVENRGGYMVRCNGPCEMANVDTGFYDGAAERAIAAWNKRANDRWERP
jgi:hypothetical protein